MTIHCSGRKVVVVVVGGVVVAGLMVGVMVVAGLVMVADIPLMTDDER